MTRAEREAHGSCPLSDLEESVASATRIWAKGYLAGFKKARELALAAAESKLWAGQNNPTGRQIAEAIRNLEKE